MPTDFSLKERAFVAELATETGRDLNGWMRAIEASGQAHRNDIIDWLRQQGFTFAKASWLERIHHNGGALIYAHTGPQDVGEPGKRKTKPVPTQPAAGPKADVRDDQRIDALLMAAKAYRPLASVMLREILGAVPGADARVHGGTIVFTHIAPFAALAPSPKEVRLWLAFGPQAVGEPWQKARPPPGLDHLSVFTHMMIVNDARQVTRELRELVASRARAAGAPQ